jgi:hypothetical protein
MLVAADWLFGNECRLFWQRTKGGRASVTSTLFMSFIHKHYICAVVSCYNWRSTGWRDYRRPPCDFSRAAVARWAPRLVASLIDGDAEEDVKIFVRLLRVLLRRSRVKRRRSRSSLSCKPTTHHQIFHRSLARTYTHTTGQGKGRASIAMPAVCRHRGSYLLIVNKLLSLPRFTCPGEP